MPEFLQQKKQLTSSSLGKVKMSKMVEMKEREIKAIHNEELTREERNS
jgi:hypothetical protein